jgi:hypothetical protein
MTDTTPEMQQKQKEILKAQTSVQRIKAISDLSYFMQQMALKRIQKKHPDYTSRQVMDEYIKMQFPEECAKMKLFQ